MIRSRAPHFPWRFKLLKIWGSKPYSGRFKIFLFFFFHFQILHRKVDIFYFNHFLISCRNQIKHVENFCFYWYLICKTRYLVKQFFIENLKMSRKRTKKILTFRSGDLNPRFSVIFPPIIWIFMVARVTWSNPNKLLKEIGLYIHCVAYI